MNIPDSAFLAALGTVAAGASTVTGAVVRMLYQKQIEAQRGEVTAHERSIKNLETDLAEERRRGVEDRKAAADALARSADAERAARDEVRALTRELLDTRERADQ